MLGPESPIYEALPTPTSIRIILLAPGEKDDDVVCFLFPCDLDRDRTVDRSMPRPFESMCVAQAPASGMSEEVQFMLPVDSYIDDKESSSVRTPDVSTEPAVRKRSRLSRFFKGQRSGANKKLDGPSHDRQRPKAAEGVGKEGGNEELSDDMWDLMQLTQLTLAKDAQDIRVRRHPFQRFSALSYVWGTAEDPACITIDQTKFWVTQNLCHALKAMRRRDVALPLWIDAICINQADLDERKEQIGLMRRIYRQAKKVIAYVPQTPEDTDHFNKLMKAILQADAECRKVIEPGAVPEQVVDYEDEASNVTTGNETQPENPSNLPDELKDIARMVPLKPTGTCVEDYDIPAEDDPAWGAWRRFFASPYFRRIWILQEYALGSNLHLNFGRGEGNADMILLAMHAVKSRSRLLNAQYLGRGEDSTLTRKALLGWMGLEEMIHQRVFTRQDLYGKNNLPARLIDKLDKALLYDATDFRDKIYALLGLVSDADGFMDLVSYQPSDTYPKLYRRVAQRLIEQGHLVHVLRIACKTPTNLQLPSWVPDLSTATEDTFVATVTREREFQAGGKSKTIEASFHPHEELQLILCGCVFSAITFKSASFVPGSSNSPISTGAGRLQDLFETFLQVFHELDAQLPKDLASIMMDIFYVVTMQQKHIDSFEQDDSAMLAILDDLSLWRTVMMRIMNYQHIEGRTEHKVVFGVMPENDRDFLSRIMSNVAGRCFCIAEVQGEKRLGLVPQRASIGDSLAIVRGAPTPYVWAKVPEKVPSMSPKYRLVGDAYLQGVMMGELLQDPKMFLQDVVLV